MRPWGMGLIGLAVAVACASPDSNQRTAIVAPDRASFDPVAAYVGHRCGSLDCHGSRYRNMRVWGHDGMRLAIGDVPGGTQTTGDEIDATYQAIVDLEPADGGEPISVFESGAILLYLADKTGQFIPSDARGRKSTLEWLFWQVGGLGPMAGQNHHFSQYAPEKLPYAIERYVKETNRLYGVLDRRLRHAPYLAGDQYTIADMAAYPWIVPWERQQQDLNQFVALKRWFEGIATRQVTERAYARTAEFPSRATVNEESRKVLFGQTAANTERSR